MAQIRMDAGRAFPVAKGAWSDQNDYEVQDIVASGGGSYIAKKNVPAGTLPTNTEYWMPMAEKGDPGTTSWEGIEDKPETFPPSAHTHDDRYYTESEMDTALAGKAPASHTHDDRYYTESEVDTALGGKSDTGHTHDDRYYTESELDTLLSGKSDTSHTHDDRYYTESEMDTKLAGKSDAGHTHDDRYYTESEMDTALAGKAAASHTHDDRYYTETEMDTKLAAKAPLADPALTGVPTAPTAAMGTNSTQLATCAFVQAEIAEANNAKRYGVSGIGQSASALTRLYDAVGLLAEVGTDDPNTPVVNDFDDTDLFGGRRKCVGTWELGVDNKAHFNITAYEGEAGYIEDGTAGDYVAVEVPCTYYKRSGGNLVLSTHPFPGMKPYRFFLDESGQPMEKVYLPAYALGADANGYGQSMPGYENQQGDYAKLFKTARKYKNSALGVLAGLLPFSVYTYERDMMTVEFATQNIQNIMQGAANFRSDGNDRVTFFGDSTHVLTNNYQAGRVAGEYIAIVATSVSNHHDASKYPTHKVLAVTRCDENGNADAAGTHQLMELQDLGKNYYEYDTTGETEYKIGIRPFPTGLCADVISSSGSPISNSDGFHPMIYRGRENVFGNQWHTFADLFALRVAVESSYRLDYYFHPDTTQIATPSNPSSESALLEMGCVKIGLVTGPANYKDGYIKSIQWDAAYPDVWTPLLTTGGSASTFFCDYAYLVNSHVCRSVRGGGSASNGASVGFPFAAHNAPSFGYSSYGGDLYITQGKGVNPA